HRGDAGLVRRAVRAQRRRLQRLRARPLHPDHRRDQPLGAVGAPGRPGPRPRRTAAAGGRRARNRAGLRGRFRPPGDGREPAPDDAFRDRVQAGAGRLRAGPGRQPGRARRQPAGTDRRHRAGADALPAGRAAGRHGGRGRAARRPLVPERRAPPRPGGAAAARHDHASARAGLRGGRAGPGSGRGTAFGIMPAMPTQPTQPTLFEADPQPPAAQAAAPEAVGSAPDGDRSPGDAPADAGDDTPGRQPSLLPDNPPPSVTQLRERRPLWARLLGRLLRPWISLRTEPDAPQQFVDQRPVCYVLADYGLSNALILDRACREHGMPSPLRPLPGDPLGRKRAYVALSRRSANSALAALAAGKPAPPRTHSESLARLLEAHREDPALDVQLVPVSIFVGQAPDRASGWFSVLFSENWALVGRFRRLLAILLNGRNTLVRFAAPVNLRGIIAEDLPPERTVRKLSRVLRTHFNRIREAMIGPDLSTRRLLIDKVLASESVKDAIADQARRDKST